MCMYGQVIFNWRSMTYNAGVQRKKIGILHAFKTVNYRTGQKARLQFMYLYEQY